LLSVIVNLVSTVDHASKSSALSHTRAAVLPSSMEPTVKQVQTYIVTRVTVNNFGKRHTGCEAYVV